MDESQKGGKKKEKGVEKIVSFGGYLALQDGAIYCCLTAEGLCHLSSAPPYFLSRVSAGSRQI